MILTKQEFTYIVWTVRGSPAGGRQEDIADAILKVAQREGIGALTMERLGREVGITSGALFRHFPSRTAMLNEAADRAVALLETTFPPADLPPLERLRQLVLSEQFGKALPPKGARAVRDVVLHTHDFALGPRLESDPPAGTSAGRSTSPIEGVQS